MQKKFRNSNFSTKLSQLYCKWYELYFCYQNFIVFIINSFFNEQFLKIVENMVKIPHTLLIKEHLL